MQILIPEIIKKLGKATVHEKRIAGSLLRRSSKFKALSQIEKVTAKFGKPQHLGVRSGQSQIKDFNGQAILNNARGSGQFLLGKLRAGSGSKKALIHRYTYLMCKFIT